MPGRDAAAGAGERPAARFITFEGGEGAGKSTQAALLAESLRGLGAEVVTTREPGGSPEAEAVRRLILAPEEDWTPLSEALLLAAARSEHLHSTIRPALARGAWVLCDRFADSTRAYQGHGLGLSSAALATLERLVVAETQPDLTLILDLPPEVGLARRRAADGQGASDRYELRALDFHQRVRAGFLALAEAAPERCAVVPAEAEPAQVAARVRAVVQQRLGVPV